MYRGMNLERTTMEAKIYGLESFKLGLFGCMEIREN
jgi:hypothetical protein